MRVKVYLSAVKSNVHKHKHSDTLNIYFPV